MTGNGFSDFHFFTLPCSLFPKFQCLPIPIQYCDLFGPISFHSHSQFVCREETDSKHFKIRIMQFRSQTAETHQVMLNVWCLRILCQFHRSLSHSSVAIFAYSWAETAICLLNQHSDWWDRDTVVVLEESPCPQGSSRTNLQVLVLVLELQTPRKFSRTACVFETVFVWKLSAA